ncbi:MAG: flavin-containing monooxygenase [Gammaproteobacteria bacterium]
MSSVSATPRVAIIGAGMSGILAALEFRASGYSDVTVYEKADRLGGTWRDNTYPGLTCDVPSQHYCYSFEPNPEWSRLFSPGSEIQAYLEGVAAKHHVTERIRFRKELATARFADGTWQLEFKDGTHVEADIVIAATGVLHHPLWPEIEGVGSFDGPAFHTARWDHSVSLQGKRIGIIGTGSTAIQIVPAIIDEVARLTLFQRTAQWIFPLPNPAFTEEQKAAFRADPALMHQAYQQWLHRIRTTIARAVIGDQAQMAKIAQACQDNLANSVRDPALRAKLTPDYAVACKRLIMSETFYDAIQRPNAHLETGAIARIEPRGVRLRDGTLHELDVLVYATGFDAHRFVRPIEVIGRNGLTLEEAWREAPRTHRSLTVPGFPNFFMLIGPNSPIGNFSLIMVAEMQVAYLLKLLAPLREGIARTVEPTAEAAAAFNQAIRDSMSGTVWVTGCRSWYLDRNGQPILWPWTLERFQEEMAAPNLHEYALAS